MQQGTLHLAAGTHHVHRLGVVSIEYRGGRGGLKAGEFLKAGEGPGAGPWTDQWQIQLFVIISNMVKPEPKAVGQLTAAPAMRAAETTAVNRILREVFE